MTRTSRVVAAVIALALVAPAAASAEWFAGLYLGVALTSNGDVEFDPDSANRCLPRTFEDVEFDKSIVWGGRGGYWFSKDELFGDLGEFLGMTPSFDFSAGTVDIPINSHQPNIGVSYRF